MSIYMTEDEQIEAIKKFWKKYNTLIIVTISLILFIASGVKYWYWHQNKITVQASKTYEQLMVAFSNQDNKSVKSYANELIEDYHSTVYADVARFALAKLYIERGQYDKAIETLKVAMETAHSKALKQVAKLRIARLLVSKEAYKPALLTLAAVDDPGYLPLINELKGDIYSSMGNYQKAVMAYQMAIKETRAQGMGNLFLEMKTNEMVALSHQVSVQDAPVQTV
jgi:predicted negative regulator of RcsB-dependent stress response